MTPLKTPSDGQMNIEIPVPISVDNSNTFKVELFQHFRTKCYCTNALIPCSHSERKEYLKQIVCNSCYWNSLTQHILCLCQKAT